MTTRIRFPEPAEDASGVAEVCRGMTFEEMVAALFGVLRDYPDVMAKVEEVFIGMAKRRVANDGAG